MLRISFFLVYSTLLSDFLATSLILVNRWTAITMAIQYKKPYFSLFPFPLSPVLCVVFLIVCIFINIGTLISYRKHRKNDKGNKSNQQKNNEKIEYKLMIYAIITFIGHVIMVIEQLSTSIFNKYPEISAAVLTQYPWTMDFGSVVLPSWLLFWASDNFRKYIFNNFCPKWLQKLLQKNNNIATMVKPIRNGQNTI
uniref:Serpentine receptor class gamma n=1 Tax=Meloidogyne hapla TaxID=6305 RepID=A0A1I8BSB5_MELHA